VINPCGKLAETFPVHLEDVLSSRYFPCGPKTVEYREGLFVGYRYFDCAQKPTLFPFGHGLSYTTFEYRALKLSAQRLIDQQPLSVSLVVRNTGTKAGAEVVQLYVHDCESAVYRPPKELKGFEKVFLKPGESAEVNMVLDRRAFAFYNTQIGDWTVESGAFDILVGASSQDIRLMATVQVDASQPNVPIPDLHGPAGVYFDMARARQGIDDTAFQSVYGAPIPSNRRAPGEKYDINKPLGDIKNNLIGRRLYKQVLEHVNSMFGADEDETFKIMALNMVDDLPLRNLVTMSNGEFSMEMVQSLLLLMNGYFVSGFWSLLKVAVKE
jgi:beta-glucosidase